MNDTDRLSDGELAVRIQARDAQAFEQIFARYGEALVRHVEAMLRDEAAAQDVTQEAFLRVWTRAEQWNGSGSFKAWLYRIATNLALNTLRTLRRHPSQPLAPEEDAPWDEWSEGEGVLAPGWLVDTSTLGPDSALEQAEEYDRFRRAFNGLPAEKRDVFRLVHEMELSIRDAAGQLGIPEGTVKSRLHYAEKQLNQAWQESDAGEE